jgi:hypothetical protein
MTDEAPCHSSRLPDLERWPARGRAKGASLPVREPLSVGEAGVCWPRLAFQWEVVVASVAEWPALRWKLTAPETYVLNSVGQGFGVEAFKLAVKELVARRALRVEPVETRGWHGLRTARSVLVEGPVRLAPEPSLAPVLELFAAARKRPFQAGAGSAAGMRPVEGVLTEDFAKAARKQFHSFHRYQSGHVVPALEARGLMTTRKHMVLGVFPSKRPTWTARGGEAVDELERWLQVGKRRFRGWVSADPTKALAYTSGAGAAILLMDDLYPDFAVLGQHFAERRLAGGGGGDGGGAEFGEEADAHSSLNLPDADVGGVDPGAAEVDLGDLDLGALESSVSGFEGLDAAFSAIDLGIVAGGGDGGGGGGDGGGGG